MNDWLTWAAMHGYGLYVWGSIGMCALVVAAEVLQLRARRRALHRAHAWEAES